MADLIQALSGVSHAARRRLWLSIASLRRRRYERSARIPWTVGYDEYKSEYLTRVLRDEFAMQAFRENRLAPQYGYRLDARVCEIPWALSRLSPEARTVLDAGSSLNHLFAIDSPSLTERRLFVVTLAPERQAFWERGVSYLYGDLRDMEFSGGCFDAVICISTIEHIGMDNSRYGAGRPTNDGTTEYRVALRELRRVLKPGGWLYITFPFGRRANHDWFQQFDAVMLDDVIATFEPEAHEEAVFQYMPDGWATSDRERARDCVFFDIHAASSGERVELPPDVPAGERAVACLALRKPPVATTSQTQEK